MVFFQKLAGVGSFELDQLSFLSKLGHLRWLFNLDHWDPVGLFEQVGLFEVVSLFRLAGLFEQVGSFELV